jgi:hypothetical protein
VIFQVPVIAVFTKYDQFKRNLKMRLEDEDHGPGTYFETEAENVFYRDYLASLVGPPPFVRLESENSFNQFTPIFNLCYVGMHKPDQRCTDLLEVTANALSGGVVALMLMAVKRDNLELSVKQTIKW